MELTEFVEARLAEEQAAAEAAAEDVGDPDWIGSFESGHPWRYAEHGSGVYADNDGIASGATLAAWTPSESVQVHIARHDPARVLRDVETTRRIVEMHPVYHEGEDGCTWCRSRSGACETQRLVASRWDWHADYDPAWSLDGTVDR